MVVDQPLAVGEIDAVHGAVGAFAVQRDADVVALDPRAGRDRVRLEHALGRDVRLDVRDVERALRLALIGVELEHRAFADHDLGDGVGEVGRRPARR